MSSDQYVRPSEKPSGGNNMVAMVKAHWLLLAVGAAVLLYFKKRG